MKYVIFILQLGFVAFVLSAGQSSARTVCMGPASTWDECYRTITEADGNKYVGTFKNGKFEGEGKYSEANGNVYIGTWKNGIFHGEGVRSTADGAKYTGAYQAFLIGIVFPLQNGNTAIYNTAARIKTHSVNV